MDETIAKVKRFFPERLHGRLLMVGGMVRDRLLGVMCQDVDLVAAVSPSDLTSLGFQLVQSKSTPNIYFFFHKELGKIEVTRLASLDDLREDLERRDFTINAMAMRFDGELHDPLHGEEDLRKRVLRQCSAASLTDDPIRIFRALRFESEGWRLDEESEQAIRARDWSEELKAIPVERFSQEMLKSLGKDDPARFFRRMVELNVGEIFLPEIFRMPAVPAGPLQHHPEGDLFSHSMQALERMAAKSSETRARFCALFHDLGKLATPEEEYPKHHGHENAGAQAAELFCKRLRLPVQLQRGLQATCRLHGNCNRWLELRDSTKIKVATSAIKARIETFLPLIVASDSGGEMPGWEEVVRIASLTAAQLGIPPELFSDPQFPPEKCQQMILQKRVELLRQSLIFNRDELDEGDGKPKE
jgi:tRNA nucleotidyltransferase (CCA-adding enzyme)